MAPSLNSFKNELGHFLVNIADCDVDLVFCSNYRELP